MYRSAASTRRERTFQSLRAAPSRTREARWLTKAQPSHPLTPMDISDLKYARSGELHIAYQQWGSGPDLIIIPVLVASVELAWEQEV